MLANSTPSDRKIIWAGLAYVFGFWGGVFLLLRWAGWL